MVQNRHTFADSAYVTLVVAGEDLHYKDLADRILHGGYFVSKGKTPAQTLRSQISREITTRAERARFVNRDQGMISLSDFARENPDEELVEAVKAFAAAKLAGEAPPPRARKSARKKAAKKEKAPEPEATGKVSSPAPAPAPAPVAEATVASSAPAPAPAPEAGKEPPAPAREAEAPAASPAPAPAPAPVPEAGIEAPAPPPPPAPRVEEAAPEIPTATGSTPPPTEAPAPAPETAAALASEAGEPGTFIPIELEDDSDELDDEDEFVTDGTFATAEREVLLLEEEESDSTPTPAHFMEDDSEQDFLSVGPELGEMTSSEYDASMEELAPIVVPPYEGGAAEIARLPLGGRTVLIVKVVRRGGEPQIQLVEELESLVAGAVGRLLLTLPGEDVDDLLGALVQVKKVIRESFVPDAPDGLPEGTGLGA